MESLEQMVGEIPMTTDADEQAAREERTSKRPEAKAKPVEVVDSDSEEETEALADDADESDEPDTEEGSEESEDQDDPESTVLVVTVNGEELELPSNTPKAAVDAIKKMEKDLYTGFQRKTQELADARRQQESVIEQTKAESLKAQKAEIQRAQARVQSVAQAAFTPRDQLLDLADQDRDAYRRALKINDQIAEQLNTINAQIAQVDADLVDQQKKALKARVDSSWQRLEQEKITEGDVQKIIQDCNKHYGLSGEYLEDLADAAKILMMRDAIKYQKLVAERPHVRKRIAKSEKAGPKNATSTRPTRDKQREQRFNNRTATMGDLADLLMTSRG